MNTNKTREEAFEEFSRDVKDTEDSRLGYFLGAWDICLASVVEEPVLTREELERAFDLGVSLDSDSRWPGNKRNLIVTSILSAGRIPASNPTPQQEGGLTRELVERCCMGDLPDTLWNAIQSNERRHTQALEAKGDMGLIYRRDCLGGVK